MSGNTLSKEARELKNKYQRTYHLAHPEKNKEYCRRYRAKLKAKNQLQEKRNQYWERKAQGMEEVKENG